MNYFFMQYELIKTTVLHFEKKNVLQVIRLLINRMQRHASRIVEK